MRETVSTVLNGHRSEIKTRVMDAAKAEIKARLAEIRKGARRAQRLFRKRTGGTKDLRRNESNSSSRSDGQGLVDLRLANEAEVATIAPLITWLEAQSPIDQPASNLQGPWHHC